MNLLIRLHTRSGAYESKNLSHAPQAKKGKKEAGCQGAKIANTPRMQKKVGRMREKFFHMPRRQKKAKRKRGVRGQKSFPRPAGPKTNILWQNLGTGEILFNLSCIHGFYRRDL